MKKKIPVLADRVELLFEKRRREDGREYTLQELQDKTGISTTNFWKVRKGINKNPGYDVLMALCNFFNVSLGYFECKSWDECSSFLDRDTVTNAGETVSEIALRASELSDEGRKAIVGMIEYVRAAEELQKKKKS